MRGILNINKPKGITSSDVVSRVRKILSTKQVGHFGTLDPMGEGVLPLGVGKATRLFNHMLKKDKVYEARFCFGYSTDTLDCEGNILYQGGRIPTLSEIQSVLHEFTGKQYQMPPSYSAKNIRGKRAYELARDGKTFELTPCEITIYDLNIKSTNEPSVFDVILHCSSGTYVRSFGRDLAERLGTCAVMTAIKRIRSGIYDLSTSVTLQELESLKENAILDVETALTDIPHVDMPDECYEYLSKGIKLESRGINYDSFALYCKGELFGIATCTSDGKIKISSYLRD